MGEITVTIDDQVEKELRTYVTRIYPEKPFGKLSKVVNEAISEYLKGKCGIH